MKPGRIVPDGELCWRVDVAGTPERWYRYAWARWWTKTADGPWERTATVPESVRRLLLKAAA